MTSPNNFIIEYKLIVRQTNQTRLRVAEVNEDREYLEAKAKKLEAENPNWQVFVVRENYNVSQKAVVMERHMEYMKRRLREEAEKCKIKDVLMNPLEASKRIVALEKRLDELEGALIAERTREVKPD